jgi:FixJ family two-component response regulator
LRLPRENKHRWTGAREFEAGAVGFLLKPFSDTLLLSVEAALRTM